MSLNKGPTVSKIISTEECLRILTELGKKFHEQTSLHNKKLSEFLREFNLRDVKQITSRYPNTSLNLLTESAYHYYLMLNGTVVIIAHGIEALIQHLNINHQELNIQLCSLKSNIIDLALLKIEIDDRLQDHLKKHPDIKKDSLADLHKQSLRRQINEIELQIASLSDAERLAIEYYEVIVKAEVIHAHLNELSISMDSLATQLRTMTPAAVVEEEVDESFGKCFTDDTVFSSSGDDLSALLSAKLQIKPSDDDESIDWDKLSGSNRSSLAEALPASLPAILRQYELEQQGTPLSTTASSLPSSSAPSSEPPPADLPRPGY